MKPWTYTWQAIIDDVIVVGFVARALEGGSPDATFDRDVADFRARMEGLGDTGPAMSAVVDFSDYRMTDWDNGRTVFGLLLAAHRRLEARGGEVCVCGHPAQLNPDLQGLFHMDRFIDIYRTRREALDAVLSRREGAARAPRSAGSDAQRGDPADPLARAADLGRSAPQGVDRSELDRLARYRKTHHFMKSPGGLALARAVAHSYMNRSEIERSEHCRCFNCFARFPPSKVALWCDSTDREDEDPGALRTDDSRFKGTTAVCPFCEYPDVLGSASGISISNEFLIQVREYWYRK